MAAVRRFLAGFWPGRMRVGGRERWRALLGGGLGILLTALVSHWWAGPALASPWLVAPVGASAVLVFAVPASPLAQPWAVIGGNTLSALVGALCAMAIPNPAIAGAVAVALAIGLMFSLRCLHPPGGASALLSALGGVGLHFVLFPMLANCVLLVLAGIAYNGLTGRRYPHAQVAQAAPAHAAGARARFSAADLDTALAHYNQVLDISRDDLEELLHHAESAAYQRRFGDLRCSDVMSGEPLAVQFGTPLDEAWALMREHRVKALPVTDRARHIVGIVTVADFMRHAGLDQHHGIGHRLRALVLPSGKVHSDKPEVVGQIMTREVRVASAGRRASELIPLFSEAGHHHIPIIDEDRRLVGIITQSDLVRALYQAA
ncbi:MAG: HPP family protein [Pseudomonadota bacterium]